MATISLCMIVKNEEAVLARCLDSVRDLVDEIIIEDTVIPVRSMISPGRVIFPPHGIFLFPRLIWTISTPPMRTKC